MNKLIFVSLGLLLFSFYNSSDSLSAEDVICNYGYEKFGMSCVKINVPHNAYIDSSTNTWKCNPGFVKNGNLCAKIYIPINASLNIQKSDWVCNDGYIKDGNSCRQMTVSQKQKYDAELTKKQIGLYNYRKENLKLFGDACEEEYKTGATVCISNLNSNLHCSKSFSGDHYTGCSVEIEYYIETNYKGKSQIYSDVDCTASIYKTRRDSYIKSNDEQSEDDNMISLSANDNEKRQITIDFMPFYSFSAVTSVSLDNVKCELKRVYIY